MGLVLRGSGTLHQRRVLSAAQPGSGQGPQRSPEGTPTVPSLSILITRAVPRKLCQRVPPRTSSSKGEVCVPPLPRVTLGTDLRVLSGGGNISTLQGYLRRAKTLQVRGPHVADKWRGKPRPQVPPGVCPSHPTLHPSSDGWERGVSPSPDSPCLSQGEGGWGGRGRGPLHPRPPSSAPGWRERPWKVGGSPEHTSRGGASIPRSEVSGRTGWSRWP